MTDFQRLSIAIDSKSAQAATKELERLGTTADVASAKVRRLSAAMNATGQSVGDTRSQMAQLKMCLVATAASAPEASRAISKLTEVNLDLAKSAEIVEQPLYMYKNAITATSNEIGYLIRQLEKLNVGFVTTFQTELASGIDALTSRLNGVSEMLDEVHKRNNTEYGSSQMKISASTDITTFSTTDLMQIVNSTSDIQEFIQTKLQAVMASRHLAAAGKIECAEEINTTAARKINTIAMYDQAINSHKITIAKMNEAMWTDKITALEYKEAVVRHANTVKTLEQGRADVIAGKGKSSLVDALTSIISPMGLVTLAISAGTAAWGYFQAEIRRGGSSGRKCQDAYRRTEQDAKRSHAGHAQAGFSTRQSEGEHGRAHAGKKEDAGDTSGNTENAARCSERSRC